VTLPVGAKDAAVVFTARLGRGKTRLQAWLVDDIENGETNGAFTVDVRRRD